MSVARIEDGDPLWYKDAIIYQLHVRGYCDTASDGIGDFAGLTQKLDYLQDLGVTAIWVQPFYPSPLRDDGYDIADYMGVNPIYGTLKDFKTFLREAHARGLRVITELVLNHTSDQHEWFQRARRSPPGSPQRDYYVWSDTPEKYQDARIIFQDFETSNWAWDPVAKAYYWHRFYSHQPDLNFENPLVRRELFKVVDHWLGMGVDGLRLDAVPYLYEAEGTNCENLPATHQFLKDLRAHVDANFPNRMLLAEANQWPEDVVPFFGGGDECHSAFHFPIMPRLFMSIHMEDRFPIVDIMEQTPAIPDNCQWIVFLRNHDELTLEMVTDEERDYMYRVYAHDRQARVNLGIRRRLAPLLGNNRRKFELMKGLLFSLPGTPVIYYGDEIGMGDNIYLGDRNGVRTPMQWSGDRNAGFSRANPQKLYLPIIIDPEYHYESVNVENQQSNPASLYWWMKRLTSLRQRYPVFGRGTLQFLSPENSKVLAFVRSYGEQHGLVVANLSRFVQYVELDLSAYEGARPIELFGQTNFPPIRHGQPYVLTLGPHTFYWFDLVREHAAIGIAPSEGRERSALTVAESWEDVLSGKLKARLEEVLRHELPTRRWFAGKSRTIRQVAIEDVVPVGHTIQDEKAFFVLLRVEYGEGEPDSYAVPLSFASGDYAQRISADWPQAVFGRVAVTASGARGVLFDAVFDQRFMQEVFEAAVRRREFRGRSGELVAWPTAHLTRIRGEGEGQTVTPSVLPDQSNSSVVYNDRFILKLFRKVDAGLNPDLETSRFLSEVAEYPHVAPVAGAIEYRQDEREPITLAMLSGFVPNEGTAWHYSQNYLSRFFEMVLSQPGALDNQIDKGDTSFVSRATCDVPESVRGTLGEYLESVALLGRRTAEMHQALVSQPDNLSFAPQIFSPAYQRSLYQSLRKLAGRVLPAVRKRAAQLPAEAQPLACKLAEHEGDVRRAIHVLMEQRLSGQRVRCHGDFHLGQVLFTGKDFVIIDFEGEVARPISERVLKRSSLRDVASMLRSFDYVAAFALSRQQAQTGSQAENLALLQRAARYWRTWSGCVFLKSYLETAGKAAFLPRQPDEIDALLRVLMLERSLYELGEELTNRPEWVAVPLRGVLELVGVHSE